MKNKRLTWLLVTCMACLFILSGCTWIGHKRRTPQESLPYPYPISTIGLAGLVTPTAPIQASGTPDAVMAGIYPAPGGESPYPGVQVPAGAYPPPSPFANNTASSSLVGTPGVTATPGLAYPAPPGGSTDLATLTPDLRGTSETPASSSIAVITPTGTTFLVRTKIVATDPSTVVLAAGKPQLVEFFAYWCTICKSMAPTVHALENKYREKMNFIYLDVDDPKTADLRAELGYQLITRPHFYLLDGQGNVIRDWIGYMPEDELEKTLLSALGG